MTTAPARGLFKSIQAKERYHQIYDDMINRWPNRPDSTFLRTPKGLTHCLSFGHPDGVPLILLHGANSSSAIWLDMATNLGEVYKVYALDIIGDYGKSVPDGKIKNLDDCMDWLEEVLLALNIESAYFVGFSYGGWLTMKFCQKFPDLVQKAVVMSPAATFKSLKVKFLLRAIYSMIMPTKSVVKGFYYYSSEESCRNESGYREKMDCLVDLVYAGRKMKAQIVNPTVLTDQELSAIKVSLAVMIGENDVIYDPQKALERAKMLIPNVTTQLVPKASHDLMFSQPEFVTHKIREFLGENLKI